MEKPTSMKTSHGSLALKSRNNRDIDAYFSSYLTIDDPIFELRIFDAHKNFFNQVNHHHHIQKLTISRNTRVSPFGDARNYIDRSFAAVTAKTAPSPSSEANWNNSHTGLFPLLSGAKSVSMSNHQSRSTELKKKIKASFSKPIRLCRRKCPCADKKSVQVKEMKPATKTQVPAAAAPPPFPSHNPNARVSLDHKRKDLESNPRTPMEKSSMSETAGDKSEAHRTPIPPNNMVDQKPSNQDVLITKSQMFHAAEKDDEASTILQPQQVMASLKPVTDGFTFPLLNPKSVQEHPPCNYLEVFGPLPYIGPSCVSQSPKSGILDDDPASDASSDLFEIVTFPTQATSTQSGTNSDAKPLGAVINSGFLFKSKESMTRTVTEKHEPREPSIDRSMSSGEGFEFDTTGTVNLEFGDGGETHRETSKTHLVGSPLSTCQTAHISLDFAT